MRKHLVLGANDKFLPKGSLSNSFRYNFGKPHVDHDGLGLKICMLNIGFFPNVSRKFSLAKLAHNYQSITPPISNSYEADLKIFGPVLVMLLASY